MMFSVVVWSESQDTSGALTTVAAVTDQHITYDGDDILVPSFAPNLVGVMGIGATISRCQISSPTLRRGLIYDVEPVNIAAGPNDPPAWHNRFINPLPLTVGEGLRAFVAEGAAGAEQDSVVAFLEGDHTAAPSGQIQTVRATSATTLTAYAWSQCPLTLSQQLEAGTYEIVGMRAMSANAIAARLIMPGSQFRPGVIAVNDAEETGDTVFRYGNLGSFGQFEHTFVPSVEFFSGVADTAEVVHLDLIKV
jgi:hypothetical protein